MNNNLILYRADKKGNDTLPEKFYTDGLFTRQLDSKDHPIPFEKYGWLNTINSHIAPNDEIQKFIYSTSAFLSFTTESQIVDKYLGTRNKLSFVKTERENAEAYKITAQISKSELKNAGKGLLIFEYACNYNKVRTSKKYSSLVSDYIDCKICKRNSNYLHRLLVIDAVDFLEGIKDKFQQAYLNAINDKEYLLLPLDPMLNGPHNVGFQSRIPIADFWDIDFYKYEKQRNANKK